MMICSKHKAGEKALNVCEPRHSAPSSAPNAQVKPLRYYNSQVHRAAFALPQFAQEALQGLLSYQ